MLNYIDAPALNGCETIDEYRRSRPRHQHHPFLRAVVARIRNR